MNHSSNKQNIPSLFSCVADRNALSPALKLHERHMTYHELDEASSRVASHLIDIGVGRETLIGICMPRSFEMVVGMLAIMKAGAAYVPIDPAYPQTRIEYILNDSNLSIVLSHSQIRCKELRQAGKWLNLNDWLDGQSANGSISAKGAISSPDYSFIASDNLAYVIYTSGSTGNPKGVMIEHRAVINLLRGLLERTKINDARRWLGIAPVVFDASVGDWMACLVSGGCYVIPDDDQIGDPFILGRMINDYDVNVMVATPSRWKQIINAGWEGKNDLVVMCGGEPLTHTLLNEISQRCHTLWNCYGPTEATVWSLVRKVDSKCDNQPLAIANSLPNYAHLVLDSNNQPVSYQEVGELCISGLGLARAYLNRPELTAEKFIDFNSKDQPPRRIYKTGDLVKQIGEDQFLYMGRVDDQVKIRGYRVELGEIESKLNTISDIADAVVLYLPINDTSDQYGLVAYIESFKSDNSSGAASSKETSRSSEARQTRHRQQLTALLPDYMIPAKFIYLPSLPVTPNGKVDKKSLPSPWDVTDRKSHAKAETPAENEIAKIWNILFSNQAIDINANFFALGGNSLLAVTLVNEIRRQCDFPSFNLNDVAEFPTVKDQAKALVQYRLRRTAVEQQAYQASANEREVFTL